MNSKSIPQHQNLAQSGSDGWPSRIETATCLPVTCDRERGEIGHWWPDFLPDGRTALFTIFTDEGSHRIGVLDLQMGTWKHLFPGMQARYAASGHLIYFASGIYHVVPFDPSRVESRGSAVPVLATTRGIQSTGSQLASRESLLAHYGVEARPVAQRELEQELIAVDPRLPRRARGHGRGVAPRGSILRPREQLLGRCCS